MLGIKRADRITNTEVYARVNEQPLTVDYIRRQLTWVGHMLRRDINDPIRKYALYHPEAKIGTARRGRPTPSFINYIAGLMSDSVRLTATEIEKAAQDHDKWKSIVLACSKAASWHT